MEVGPGYKTTEVGVIPEDWDACSLDQVADPKRPICYGIVQVGPFSNNGIPVLAIKNLNGDYLGNIHLCSRQIESAYVRSRVRPGDVLVSVKGTIGRIGLVPPHFSGNISRDLARIALTDSDVSEFWYQLLQSEAAQRRLETTAVGTTRMELSIGPMKKIKMPRPSKDEQRAIARALGDVDALLLALEQLLSKKRDIKRAVLQQLLTGQTRLPGFHGEWEVKQIGDFTDCKAGGTPSTRISIYWGGSIRWMSSGELHLKRVYEVEGRITELGLSNSSAQMIPRNCVLVGLAGQGKTRGTIAMNCVELCTNQSIAAIFPNPTFVPDYLYYNLDSRYAELRELSTGAGGRGGLNLTIIKAIPIPFPSFDEQLAIAAVLSDMDTDLMLLEQRLTKTRALKQGMMQELLTGRTRLI